MEKLILFDPRQHITLRGIYDQALTLGDKIVGYYETDTEVEKRFSINLEVAEAYAILRRKKQNHFVWEFIQENAGNFYMNINENSHALARDFLTLSNTHEISNDHILLSSGTIGSGKFSDNQEYAKAKLNDHNFSLQKFYGNKLNCDIFTFSHYWTEHQYALFKREYSSQLDSLAGQILEQRNRLKNEGKPHAQSDVFFAVKEFFRSHLLSAPSDNKLLEAWKIAARIDTSLSKPGRPKKSAVSKTKR